jgi:AhpD family alkylhydroperoxidase
MPATPLARVSPDRLPPELRAVWQLAMDRAGDATAVEAWANSLPMLDWYFRGFYEQVFYGKDPRLTLDVRTKELIRIKLSKQHGCRFCNRWNTVDALEHGITQAQIDHVVEGSTQYFDERDRAVIELADQMMLQNMAGQLTPDLHARLRRYYSDEQIVEMGFVAAILTGMAKYVFVFDLVEREEACPIRRPA